jgi:hypothetical protein
VRCAAILQAQISESTGRCTTDHQASFGAPILACIHGLSGQQTKVLGRERILQAELSFAKSEAYKRKTFLVACSSLEKEFHADWPE